MEKITHLSYSLHTTTVPAFIIDTYFIYTCVTKAKPQINPNPTKQTMKKQLEKMRYIMWLWLVLCAFAVMESEGADLASRCNLLVQKVIPCLNFATGKVAVPTKDCCDATSEIKVSDPACLCFAIQQTHKGSPEVKSMGIQEGRLLQLPTACHLNNASTTNCPKLLGLSPNSPDAAIFKNASSLRTNSASTVGTATPVSDNNQIKGSYGNMLRPAFMSDLIAVVWAILLVMIPICSVNIYS